MPTAPIYRHSSRLSNEDRALLYRNRRVRSQVALRLLSAPSIEMLQLEEDSAGMGYGSYTEVYKKWVEARKKEEEKRAGEIAASAVKTFHNY